MRWTSISDEIIGHNLQASLTKISRKSTFAKSNTIVVVKPTRIEECKPTTTFSWAISCFYFCWFGCWRKPRNRQIFMKPTPAMIYWDFTGISMFCGMPRWSLVAVKCCEEIPLCSQEKMGFNLAFCPSIKVCRKCQEISRALRRCLFKQIITDPLISLSKCMLTDVDLLILF